MASLVGKLETEVEIKASAGEFYEMFAGRPYLVSEASPGLIQGCDLQDGEWGTIGSVFVWKYVHDGKLKVAKEIVMEMDQENNMIKSNVIGGDLMDEYKSFVIKLQVTSKNEETGSIVHWHLEYEKISEEVAPPEALLQFYVQVSKEVDKHLSSEG